MIDRSNVVTKGNNNRHGDHIVAVLVCIGEERNN